MRFGTIAMLLASVGSAFASDIPEFIHICARNNPDLNGCITESIRNIRTYLAKGIPEFNIPSLEPLVLEELVAVQGGGIKLSAKDINTYGCSDFTVSNLKVNLEELTVEADVFLPNLYVDGKYFLEGKVLLLPLTGSGAINGNFTDCSGAIKMKGELRKGDDGEDHLYCSSFEVDIAVGKGSIHLDNLFGGDPVIGEVVNSAINSSFDIFIRELRPLIEHTLAKAFKDIANNIVEPFAFKQLIPDG